MREKIDATINPRWPFRSITTPGHNMTLHALIAEISCLMLFGKLPKYFWRKSSGASFEAINHYERVRRELASWEKRDKQPLKSTYTVLYFTYVRHMEDKIVELCEETVVEDDRDEIDEDDLCDVDDGFEVDERELQKSRGRVLRLSKDM